MTPPGLRERKKAMTRQSIADITLSLVMEKGLSEVSTDEIAHEAFVSKRTVTNYFSHKEEAIVAAGRISLDGLVDQLVDAPDDEVPLLSLQRIMTDLVRTLTPDDREVYQDKLVLAALHPLVTAFLGVCYQDLEEDLALVLAERSGVDETADLYPRMLAAAAVAALRLSLELWASATSGFTLVDTLHEAFLLMQGGFPDPA